MPRRTAMEAVESEMAQTAKRLTAARTRLQVANQAVAAAKLTVSTVQDEIKALEQRRDDLSMAHQALQGPAPDREIKVSDAGVGVEAQVAEAVS